jgi:thiol-disulfide isomerase/thioredoxin
LTFWAAQAQLSDGTKAPEITITDQEGDIHVLYDYLNAGKTVIIDIFATWCGPCWTLHQNHVLENIYQAYGPDGTDELMVFSIEGDAATSHADLLGTGGNTQGNWVEGISFPIIEDTSIPGLFGLTYWPTIYVIRPNGNMVLANDYCWLNLLDPSQDWVYNLAFRGPNDVLANTTQTDRVICGNTIYTGGVQLKNMGTSPLTSATVEMLFNGVVAQTKNWTGNLAEFKSANVFFTPTTLSEYTEITFVASLPNGEVDAYTFDNTDGVTYDFPVATTTLEFSITTDFWPEEIGWQLQDPSGNVLYSDADFGTLECDQTYNQTFELATDGCHKLVLTDDYGDGLLNGPVNPGSHSCGTPNGQQSIAMGAIALVSNGTVLFDNISYGSGIQVPFKYEESSAVNPIANLESVEIYPNPAQTFVELELNLSQNTDITLEVLDVNGKTLLHRTSRTFVAGNHIEHIDVANFVNGTYFVRLTEKNNVNTLKFTVVN